MRFLNVLSRFIYAMTAEDAERIFSQEGNTPPNGKGQDETPSPFPQQEDVFSWG